MGFNYPNLCTNLIVFDMTYYYFKFFLIHVSEYIAILKTIYYILYIIFQLPNHGGTAPLISIRNF